MRQRFMVGVALAVVIACALVKFDHQPKPMRTADICAICAAVQGTPLWDAFLCSQLCPNGGGGNGQGS